MTDPVRGNKRIRIDCTAAHSSSIHIVVSAIADSTQRACRPYRSISIHDYRSLVTIPGFQANTTHLWVAGSAGTGDLGLGMLTGTSPAIAALAGGGYEVAFQANTTSLWTVGTDPHGAWNLGMRTGTSPAIAR